MSKGKQLASLLLKLPQICAVMNIKTLNMYISCDKKDWGAFTSLLPAWPQHHKVRGPGLIRRALFEW